MKSLPVLLLILYDLLAEIVLESLKNALLRGVVALEVVAVPELAYCLVLIFAESLWHVNADVHHKVAVSSAVTLHCWQALSTQT